MKTPKEELTDKMLQAIDNVPDVVNSIDIASDKCADIAIKSQIDLLKKLQMKLSLNDYLYNQFEYEITALTKHHINHLEY